MRSWRRKFPPVLLGGLALLALTAPAALGQEQDECNGFIDLDYNPPVSNPPPAPPFNVNVKITLGGGEIIGGPVTPMISPDVTKRSTT
jgi:hypothetical protein